MAFFKDTPAAPKPVPRVDSYAQSANEATHIGPHINVEGTVTGGDRVVIDGNVKGKINVTGDLHIGRQAQVEASVHAKNVTIEGKLTGDISADDRVELVMTSTVDGNIKAPKIVVAEGAKFRGSVDMGSLKPKEDPSTTLGMTTAQAKTK